MRALDIGQWSIILIIKSNGLALIITFRYPTVNAKVSFRIQHFSNPNQNKSTKLSTSYFMNYNHHESIHPILISNQFARYAYKTNAESRTLINCCDVLATVTKMLLFCANKMYGAFSTPQIEFRNQN